MYFSNRQHISKNKWDTEKLHLWRGRKDISRTSWRNLVELRSPHFYKRGVVHKK